MITPQPTDGNGRLIPSVHGIKQIFSTEAMDGTFKAVTLPCDAKSVAIQVHNGSATDFTSFASNPPGFHFAPNASPGTNFMQCVGTLSFDGVQPEGVTIGYVRAAAGNYCVVTVLA